MEIVVGSGRKPDFLAVRGVDPLTRDRVRDHGLAHRERVEDLQFRPPTVSNRADVEGRLFKNGPYIVDEAVNAEGWILRGKSYSTRRRVCTHEVKFRGRHRLF